jgi:glycyl-tRNA synthetase
VECTYGWVECVGLADRSAFDLRAHSEKSKVDLVARETFATPQLVKGLKAVPDRKEMGKAFKQQAKAVEKALTDATEEDKQCWAGQLESDGAFSVSAAGADFSVTAAMVSFKPEERKVTGRSFTPSVIEPSFGVGRILYCLFEHAFYARDGDAQRTVFRFSPVVAPVKVTVFPLLQREDLNKPSQQIASALKAEGLSVVIDTTGTTIGKRYARTDEIGVPFAVTVDYDTLSDDTVTVRERDTTKQVRVPAKEVPELLRRLTNLTETWDNVLTRYPAQAAAQE